MGDKTGDKFRLTHFEENICLPKYIPARFMVLMPTRWKSKSIRAGGIRQTVIVGLPDAAVKESKDRVNTAILNSGFEMPKERLTINLAPADIKKEGPIFDLPIALGVLGTMGDVPMEALAQFAMVGELALSGEVRRARGVLPITMAMRAKKRPAILVPFDNADEAAVVGRH